ncbi:unnamed protein product [Paramecium octaurelia]|uniref:Protein kinase domain-containing protein n=1 Tax=Paramecium octaurelia TaxID=43137 RepID=A0A8S1V603_PAROT|nr:unnamed protein product [Paramecium octaurelia]
MELGLGAFGVMKKVFDKQRSKSVAIKEIKLIDQGVSNSTMREIFLIETKYFIEQQKIFLVFELMQMISVNTQMRINQQFKLDKANHILNTFWFTLLPWQKSFTQRSQTTKYSIKWNDNKNCKLRNVQSFSNLNEKILIRSLYSIVECSRNSTRR